MRFAPIADSADGLGAPLPPGEPRWHAFGHPLLPRAEIGFAVAAPVLRMREGRRRVTLTLGLDGLDAGLRGMRVGGRRLLVVPPKLAYGADGSGDIVPHEALVFVVDLLKVA